MIVPVVVALLGYLNFFWFYRRPLIRGVRRLLRLCSRLQYAKLGQALQTAPGHGAGDGAQHATHHPHAITGNRHAGWASGGASTRTTTGEVSTYLPGSTTHGSLSPGESEGSDTTATPTPSSGSGEQGRGVDEEDGSLVGPASLALLHAPLVLNAQLPGPEVDSLSPSA